MDRGAGVRYVGLYRTPANRTKIGEAALEAIEKEVLQEGEVVVVGDLNMDTRSANPTPIALRNLLRGKKNLQQHVKFVTHKRPNQKVGTTIDHIWAPFTCRCTARSLIKKHFASRRRPKCFF